MTQPRSHPTTSVIIPARDASQTIEECLGAVFAQQQPPVEVIVVDDGSHDDTAERAKKFPVKLLTQPHLGPAAARNRGALLASGELLLFTDSDCAPAPDWTSRLSKVFADPSVVAAKGVYRTRQREPLARFVQLEYEEKYARLARQATIDFVDTYCAAYRRTRFLEQGGFDESFPSASVEDQELSFRLAAQQLKMVFAPQASVYHHHATTIHAYARRKFRIGYWKVRVGRRHPSKMFSDAHTPPTLKFQVAMAGIFLITLAIGVFLPVAFLLAVLAALAFGISAIPLLRFIRVCDRALMTRAPIYLAVRALSLGMGLAVGVLAEAARSERLKRGVDIVGACIGLAIFSPLMLCIALAVRLDTPGSSVFVQTRAGKDGRPFRLYKFRTMVSGAEEELPRVTRQSILPAPLVKIPNDPRVTRVGRLLRRSSLDELPQLFNVLSGDMSLVGPRPEELRVVAQYNDWQRRRLAVKPGMTGPMQINGRGLLPLDDRVALELDYIQNYSLWEDLLILARTIPAVVAGRGSY
jgi:lipopolysaccharide/colanic/teichoic acid biosynthesis glycosyltransferase/GT2 family glycosyltransferase